jgi:hypothetical protein
MKKIAESPKKPYIELLSNTSKVESSPITNKLVMAKGIMFVIHRITAKAKITIA